MCVYINSTKFQFCKRYKLVEISETPESCQTEISVWQLSGVFSSPEPKAPGELIV